LCGAWQRVTVQRRVPIPSASATPDYFSKEKAAVTRSNILYLVIGALVVVAAVLGYQVYQDRKQPEGMRIDLGPNGLKIEKK
jgi:hypothetical protein